MKTRY